MGTAMAAELASLPLWAEEPASRSGRARIRAGIGGLHCSLCTSTIEKALSRKPGVDKVAVSLTHEQALVEYDPTRIDPTELLQTLRDIGYTLHYPRKLRPFEEEERDLVREGRRFLAAVAFSLIAIALIAQPSGIWSTALPLVAALGLIGFVFLVLRAQGLWIASDRVLAEYTDALYRIRRLIKSARVSRPSRLRRQPEGERLDLEASIRATTDRRAGITPDTRVYETMELKHRDLAVLLLLDISESTKDTIRGTSTSVFSIELAAAALVAEAMTGLGDPFAISAFCSNGRGEVRYYRIKDFETPYGEQSRSRLAGLRGGLSTRMGAALRHAGHELAQQQTFRRLLLIVTDGEPSDTDVSDRRYLVEDARKAVQSLAHEGIDVFCVGLDSGGDSYLSRIFGRCNVIQIDKVTALPEKLPMLYLRLAA